MSAKEKAMSGHCTERIPELQLFTTPNCNLRTLTSDTTTYTNHHASSSSVVSCRPRGRPSGSKNKLKAPVTVTHDNHHSSCFVVNRRPRGRPLGSKNKPKAHVILTHDNHHASSSVVNRRPLGRPPGSKNKPKAPVKVMHDSSDALCSHVIEIIDGANVLESLSDYARRLGRGFCIFSGTGVLAHVTLRTSTGKIVNHQGKFEILMLYGPIFPPDVPSSARGLSVRLLGTGGQSIEGDVIAHMVASSPVMLVVASFANTTFERLPLVAYGLDEPELVGLDAAGRVEEGSGRLLNVTRSTIEMRNVMSSDINYPSSSIQGGVFGQSTSPSATSPTKHPCF